MRIHRPRLGITSSHMARYVTAMVSIPEFDLDADQEQFEGAVANEIESISPKAVLEKLAKIGQKGSLPQHLRGFAKPLLALEENKQAYSFLARGLARKLGFTVDSTENFTTNETGGDKKTPLHIDKSPAQFHVTTQGKVFLKFINAKDLFELMGKDNSALIEQYFKPKTENKKVPMLIRSGGHIYLHMDSLLALERNIDKELVESQTPSTKVKISRVLTKFADLENTLSGPNITSVLCEAGDVVLWNQFSPPNSNKRYGRLWHGAVALDTQPVRCSESFFLEYPSREPKHFTAAQLADINRRIHAHMVEIELPGIDRER